jgi:MoaA/NifB/PqqE/SkfB family radical SAM enzyme
MDGPSSEPSLQRRGHDNVIALCESARETGLYTSVTVTVTSKNHRFVRAMYEELDGRVKPNNVVFALVSTPDDGATRLGLRREPESARRDVIESLRPWASKYGYTGYLQQMEQCLLGGGLDFWRHCTMKEAVVIETDGSIRPCFSDDTPRVGTIFDRDIAHKYAAFRGTFSCEHHSEQCITQFQRKD